MIELKKNIDTSSLQQSYAVKTIGVYSSVNNAAYTQILLGSSPTRNSSDWACDSSQRFVYNGSTTRQFLIVLSTEAFPVSIGSELFFRLKINSIDFSPQYISSPWPDTAVRSVTMTWVVQLQKGSTIELLAKRTVSNITLQNFQFSVLA